MWGKFVNSAFSDVIIIFLVFLYGCQKDYFTTSKYQDISYRPSVAIPVANASYSINDLLFKLDSIVQTSDDEEGVVEIIYRDSIDPVFIADDIELPSQEFGSSLDLGLTLPISLPIGDSSASPVFVKDFTFETTHQEAIDSMYLKGTMLKVSITSRIPADINLNLKFLSIINNDNSPVELLISAGYIGSLPFTQETLLNLDGLKFDLTKGGTAKNTFSVEASMQAYSEGILFTPGELVEYKIEIIDPKLKSAYGYLGNYNFILPEMNIDFGLLDYEIEGSIEFEKTSLKFDIYNNSGLSARIDFNKADFITKSMILPLTGDIITNGFTVNAQTVNNQEEYKKSEFTIDYATSNINDIIREHPVRLNLSTSLFSNPGLDSTVINYITDSSNIISVIYASLPLSFRLGDLVGRQKYRLKMSDVNADEIEYASIKVRIVNGLPVGGKISLLFYDEFDNITLDLFNGYLDLLNPAETDVNGFPVNSSRDSTEINITNEQIYDILNCNYLVGEVVLNTSGSKEGKWAKITRDQAIEIELGLMANLNLDIKINK